MHELIRYMYISKSASHNMFCLAVIKSYWITKPIVLFRSVMRDEIFLKNYNCTQPLHKEKKLSQFFMSQFFFGPICCASKKAVKIFSDKGYMFFFYSGFLSQTMTVNRLGGVGREPSLSFFTFFTSSRTLRHLYAVCIWDI